MMRPIECIQPSLSHRLRHGPGKHGALVLPVVHPHPAALIVQLVNRQLTHQTA